MYWHTINFIADISDNFNENVNSFITQKNQLLSASEEVKNILIAFSNIENKLLEYTNSIALLSEFYMKLDLTHRELIDLKSQCIESTNKKWIAFAKARWAEDKIRNKAFLQLMDLYNYLSIDFEWFDKNNKKYTIKWGKSVKDAEFLKNNIKIKFYKNRELESQGIDLINKLMNRSLLKESITSNHPVYNSIIKSELVQNSIIKNIEAIDSSCINNPVKNISLNKSLSANIIDM